MAEDRQSEELAEILHEVRRIEVHTKRLVNGVMAGSYNSVFRGSGIEFDEVREYVDGDDPRSVDWNVTARVGKPYIKRYVEERDLHVFFVFDLSSSMDGGLGAWSARQTAARVCACLGLSATANNDKVGLIAFGERVEKFVPLDKGASHMLRIVRDCLALRASTPHGNLVAGLDYASRAVRRRSVMFVVSDFLGDGWRDAMTNCGRRHDVTAIRVLTPELSPERFERLGAGMMRLRDPQTGAVRRVDWRSRRVRAAYAERVAAWDARVHADLRRAQVECLDVPVPVIAKPDSVVRPILEYFRMREMRRFQP